MGTSICQLKKKSLPPKPWYIRPARIVFMLHLPLWFSFKIISTNLSLYHVILYIWNFSEIRLKCPLIQLQTTSKAVDTKSRFALRSNLISWLCHKISSLFFYLSYISFHFTIRNLKMISGSLPLHDHKWKEDDQTKANSFPKGKLSQFWKKYTLTYFVILVSPPK